MKKTTLTFLRKVGPSAKTTAVVYALVMVFALTMFQGCRPDPNDDPIPILTPSLIASADPEVVEIWTDTKVSYKGENLDSLYCNSVRLPNLKGDFTLTDMRKDTTFIFVGYYTTIIDGGGTKADIVEVRTLTVKVDITIHYNPPVITSLSYEAWNPGEYNENILYYGDQAKISLSLSGKYDSVYINGERLMAISIAFVGPFKKDSMFVVTVYGPGGIDKDSVLIQVTQLDEKTFWLTQNHWTIVRSWVLQNGEWSERWGGKIGHIYYFSTHNKFLVYEDITESNIGVGSWYWNENVLFLDDVYKSYIFTENSFVMLNMQENVKYELTPSSNNGKEPNWNTGGPPPPA